MVKAASCVTGALGVNAVPLPMVSQATGLAYAAKAGYLNGAYNALKEAIWALFGQCQRRMKYVHHTICFYIVFILLVRCLSFI